MSVLTSTPRLNGRYGPPDGRRSNLPAVAETLSNIATPPGDSHLDPFHANYN